MAAPEEPVLQSEPPSTAVAQSTEQQSIQLSAVRPSDQPVIAVSLSGPMEQMPSGMNKSDLIAYAIESVDRTKNLERLIWAMTALVGVVLALLGIVAILVFHYRLAGEIGVAAAAIAGIGSPSKTIWRRAKQHRQAGKPD